MRCIEYFIVSSMKNNKNIPITLPLFKNWRACMTLVMDNICTLIGLKSSCDTFTAEDPHNLYILTCCPLVVG